ncbi:MAG: hypothetical protein ACLVJ8_02210 [Ruthenibacterium lactatiformans]
MSVSGQCYMSAFLGGAAATGADVRGRAVCPSTHRARPGRPRGII